MACENTHTHLFKRKFACEFEPHHDHTSHPEEQDVVARLQQRAWIEHAQVLVLGHTKTPHTLQKCHLIGLRAEIVR